MSRSPANAFQLSPNRRALFRLLMQADGGGPQSAQPISPREATGPAPLSFAQERLWFLEQLIPGTTAFHLPLPVTLEGPLDDDALQFALNEIVRRHEVLRTTFPTERGQPIQVVAPYTPLPMNVADLSGLPEQARLAEFRRLAMEEVNRSFDLTRDLMIRALLVHMSSKEHRLVLVLHHIAADEWSLDVISGELGALYRARVAAQASPLPELSVQYADFAIWQRKSLRGNTLQTQVEYWKSQLADLPILPIPTDHPRPAVQTFEGARQAIDLSASLSKDLQRLAERERVTLFMVLLAAFSVLLRLMIGKNDVVVGTPIANRTRTELEGLVGFFVNTLVLRTDLTGDPTFLELVQRVREMATSAYAHQDLPFEELVRQLVPQRDLSHMPLFQVWFNLIGQGHRIRDRVAAKQPPSGGEPSTPRQATSQFDLALYADASGPALRLAMVYRTSLFEHESVSKLLIELRSLLQQVLARPTAPLSELSASTISVTTANGAPVFRNEPGPTNSFREFRRDEIETSIPLRFAARVAHCLENDAVITERHRWTYAMLYTFSEQVARSILTAGGSRQPLVGLLFRPGAPMVAAILGTLRAGRGYVPMDPSAPVRRLSTLIEHAEIDLLLTDAESAALAERLRVPGSLEVIAIDLDSDDDAGGSLTAMDRQHPGPDDLAYLLYTSGSTGEPKGVLQNHRNVLHFMRAYTNRLHIAADDRLTLFSSYAADAAAIDIFASLLNAASLYPYDVREKGLHPLATWIAEKGITIFHSTPSLFRAFVSTLRGDEDLSSVRLVVLAGEESYRGDLDLFKRHFARGCVLVNGLGFTESSVSLQGFFDARSTVKSTALPVGHAVDDTEVVLLDSDGHQVVGLGVGQIAIRSRHVALGYWKDPELTADRFLPDPFRDEPGARVYRTGDLGRWLPDGAIEFLGRMDDQVKIRGYRVEPGEIEFALTAHPQVREAAVMVREDRPGDRRLAAYVVTGPGPAPSPGQLRQHLAGRLPDYMVPSAFTILPALPLTPNGKLDRKALPEPERARPESEGAFVAPRTPDEEALASIWAEVLDIERVSVTDNFFELGGHSLRATQLISRIRDTLGCEIPLSVLFEAPTVADLAQALRSRAPAGAVTSTAPHAIPCRGSSRAPLSFAQQRLWFLEQLAPGTTAYNINHQLRLRGAVDVAALQRAINAMVARHETLRTTFSDDDGQAMQIIAASLRIPLPVDDLRAIPSAAAEVQARRLVTIEAQRPFDLTRGPLLRSRLAILSDTNALLLITIHHIVADGWSVAVFSRELSALYRAFRTGRPATLPPLPIQYADFAIWQRQQLSGEVLQVQLDYWKRQLANLPVLQLPTDHPRPAVQSFRGSRVDVVLDQQSVEKMLSVGRAEGGTPFMTLLAGFFILLHRMSGQSDILVGTPIANRTRTEFEGLIGFFANTLVIRCDLSADPTFRQLVAQVRDAALGAYTHQDLPFDKLVAELRPERHLSRNPLFQVLFALRSTPNAGRGAAQATAARLDLDTGTSKVDLFLDISLGPGRVSASIEYDTDLFNASTIERMGRHLHELLAGAAARPDAPVSQLPAMSADEARTVLVDWNSTERPYPATRCVHELFAEQSARAPLAPAVAFEERTLTYGQLEEGSNRLAHYLHAIGLAPGALVGVLMPRSPELIVALLGVLKAGGAYLPMDPAYPPERLRLMMDDANVQILITTDKLAVEAGGNLPLVVRVDADAPAIASHPPVPPIVKVHPRALLYVIYTSGSTGMPKGVAVEHQAVVRLAFDDEYVSLRPDNRVAQLSNLSFDAFTFEVWCTLLNGACVVVLPQDVVVSTARLATEIKHRSITVMFITTALFNAVAADFPDAFGSLTSLLVGGEALDPKSVRRVMSTSPPQRFLNAYGPTEGTTFSSWHLLTEMPALESSVPIGRPIANTRLYVVDKTGHPVPIGIPGELWIGGHGLARGYLNRPELTADRFLPDPFRDEPGARVYRTGDLGRWLPDGAIEFLGRMDDQVKIRGYRVEPGEIEFALTAHPQVREAAVMVREDRPGDRRLAAYVVTGPGPAPSPGQLRQHLAGRLPDYMVPSAFTILPALPLTPNGKLDRKALPEPERARPESEGAFVAPRTPDEEALASIWAEVLDIERVSVTDNFFELGGHSLRATQLISRIRDTLGCEIPLSVLFEAPTVADLAQALRSRAPAGAVTSTAPHAIPCRGSSRAPLSFAQQRLWFLEQLAPGTTAYNINHQLRLRGAVDVAALQRAINAMVARHETLRTTFSDDDGQAMQIIAASLRIPLPVDDLRAIPSAAAEVQARRLVTIEAQRPFDLTRGPLLRSRLAILSDTNALLLITIHHIVADGWSVAVFSRELSALYRAFRTGRPATLPPLPIQYADFAIWQRQQLSGEVLQVQLDYWKRQLANLPVLQLPTDHPRPAVQSFRGSRVDVVLPAELTAALNTLSQQEGCTLFMTLLAGFQALLGRYSNQQDVAVGTYIAGRNRSETEGLIGFFINTLVMRTSLAGAPTFRELLARVREMAVGAYTHQDVPFAKLVADIQPERDLSRNPLFQVVFHLFNAPTVKHAGNFTPASNAGVKHQSAIFDLVLSLSESPDGLSGAIEYSTDLFEAETIVRMADHFKTLLRGVVHDPDSPVGGIPLLAAAERQHLLVDWNQTAVSYDAERSIVQMFEEQVRRTPQALAFVCNGETLSYQELDRRSNQVARRLQDLGAGPETLVGIYLERSLDLPMALIGVFKAGAAYVPLDPSYPPGRLRQIFADAGVPILLTRGEPPSWLPKGGPCQILDLEANAAAIGLPPVSGSADTAAGSLAYVIYTSGSTGIPKGLAVEHRQILNRLAWMWATYPFREGEMSCQKTAANFVDSVWEIFGPLLKGVPSVIIPDYVVRDVDALVETLADHQVTRIWLVPSLLRAMLSTVADLGSRLPKLMFWVASGEELPLYLFRRFRQLMGEAKLYNLYGTSEIWDATWYDPDRNPAPQLRVPIGRPIHNVTAYVVDRDLRPVPVGIPGELCIGGSGLARGYLRTCESDAEKFISNPFDTTPGARLYRTGDQVRWLADGNLEFLGRLDLQVKLHGHRVELGEVEGVLTAHPQVREAAVMVREDRPGDRRLAAYVVTGPGPAPSPGQLRQHLAGRLPDYMVPSAFTILPALPLTPNGKLDRKALPEPEQGRAALDGAYVAPRSALEEMLAGIYGDLLGVDQPGIHDDFFTDLGGHSLLATRLVSLLRDTFRADIPLAMIFEATSVASLALSLVEDAGTRPQVEKVTNLLSTLSKMSDREVDEMLADLLKAPTPLPDLMAP